MQQENKIFTRFYYQCKHTHAFTFSQGFSEIGTGETIAVLLIKNVEEEKAKKLKNNWIYS